LASSEARRKGDPDGKDLDHAVGWDARDRQKLREREGRVNAHVNEIGEKILVYLNRTLLLKVIGPLIDMVAGSL
jgi:hypothetical protein